MRLRIVVALGVLLLVACATPVAAVAEPTPGKPFEIIPGSFRITPSTLQAGAYENLTTSFNFAHNEATGKTYNDVKTTVVNLPSGFVGSDTAVPTCTNAQLLGRGIYVGSECPIDSQVGTISLELDPLTAKPQPVKVPVYNMEVLTPGVAAEFGFKVLALTQLVPVTVRPGDLGLTATSPSIEQDGEIQNVAFTVWGDPSSPEHDAERGEECGIGSEGCHGGGQTVDIPQRPYLRNPTSCTSTPLVGSMSSNSWEEPFEGEPGSWPHASTEIGPFVECDRVPFSPSIEVQPSTRSAESPSGLEVSLVVPQSWEKPETIATSDLKDAKVTLPEGMTANPGLAAGLGACTPEQYARETYSSPPGEGCPPESKIGSIEIETPLLNEKIFGAIYIAKPYDNVPSFGDPEHPGGSLLALYVVAKDPQRGIIIKVAGKITPNPVTGQLITTFDENPQQPFSKFTLKFRPGATAPLISPPTCGSDDVLAELTPWSAPEEPRFISSQPFPITSGTHEGPCPTGGVPPFKPQVVSGTENNDASSYSSFYLRILREDGEQEITRFSTTLPPGLTGNLSGIPFCADAAIEAARTVTGQEEEEHPSCPRASEIGHSLVGAGVGSVLAQNPGKIYLAGPYHGAPLSIVSITSAKVGPFDLGTVVIRFALDINPVTAQVEVSGAQSEAIPHILRGIVVHVRDIRVYMDREKFIINPTNCSPLQITNTIDGAGANFADPADQVPVTVSTPFEAADCSSLTFKPDLAITTSAKTSRADGASLTAKLTVPGALGTQANISRVKVELPKALPSRLTTLQKACTAAQFEANPAGCPAASIIGHAKAITPILPVPLEGPAYFVSHGGEAFPDLEIVLQGYGFTIDLTASTFISKAGVTSSTFKTVPDQPVTSFELTLPEGPYSALTALGNLCTAKKLTMPTELVSQNGAEIKQSTKIAVSGCPKARHIKHKHRKHASGKHAKKGKKK